ncbi:PIR protein, putative [Plasmodium sp. gorilla clade G1]|nr:PIR protein, putative [Plasmodium sp. gorilla clade G1]
MKLHYTKLLLFWLPLNILITSSYEHNKYKQYIIPHTRTATSRVLSECDIETSIYDNDPDMKYVKENFDRQTSQRFEEYEERMITNRQKYKEQRDKDIQQIILKDKIEKSLAEKVEKGCLVCGCGLGGGVVPVWGLVSGLWYATWSQYVATTAVKIATDSGIAEGVKVGLANITKIVTELSKGTPINIPTIDGAKLITLGNFSDGVSLDSIFKTIDTTMRVQLDDGLYAQFSNWVQRLAKSPRLYSRTYSTEVAAVETAFDNAKTGILTKTANATSSLTTAITVSIIAIIVIVLVMVIIYLILRYRRKRKMKKKLQYTKLLKE